MKTELIPDDDPIFDACKAGDVETVECILKQGYSIYSNGKLSLSLMGYAIGLGHIEMVKLLLNYGLKPDQKRNKFGDTYLMITMGTNPLRMDIIELLVGAGADLEAKDNYGTTALLKASGTPSVGLLKYLIAKGADVHAKTNNKQTALWFAAQEGCYGNLDILYEAGANEHIPDSEGNTPLIRAARRGFPDVCEWLLAHGADPASKDWKKKTALDYARERGHAAVVNILQQVSKS